jgi:putative endonuclease
MYFVYVLYSDNFGKHYTGYTSDLQARILSHNETGTRDWTKNYRPWRLIHFETFQMKSEALKREKWLKSGVGRDFIATLPH